MCTHPAQSEKAPARPLDPGAPVSSATLTGGTGALVVSNSGQTVHLCLEATSDAEIFAPTEGTVLLGPIAREPNS